MAATARVVVRLKPLQKRDQEAESSSVVHCSVRVRHACAAAFKLERYALKS